MQNTKITAKHKENAKTLRNIVKPLKNKAKPTENNAKHKNYSKTLIKLQKH